MKVFLNTLGCRLNESEVDRMGRMFLNLGHEIVNDSTQAEISIINTCAVTNDAGKTSRRLIHQAHKQAPEAKIYVTGCYSEIEKQKVLDIPGVVDVISNLEKDSLVYKVLDIPEEEFDIEPLVRMAGPGELRKTRAFLKVQDGCKNKCTFCVTTLARGDSRSRPLQGILREVQNFETMGFQEVVLSGVHLGSYGQEWEEKQDIQQLIQVLLDNCNIPRIRLSSLEPWDIPQDFFRLWENPRMCQHLHIPLQSGCDKTLKRMARRTRVDGFRELVKEARMFIPHLSISTDMIVGFPGETDEEFQESLEFAREMEFSHMHIFRYSPRPGTAAATMPNQIHGSIQQERSSQMHEMMEQNKAKFLQSQLNQTRNVLWEKELDSNPEGILWQGLTENYIRVKTRVPRNLHNLITQTTLIEMDPEYNMIGRIL